MKHDTLWMVSIHERETDMDTWMSVFSSEEKADWFIEEAKKILQHYGVLDVVDVCKDFGHLDDTYYLDWIDDRYNEECNNA